MSQEQLPEPLHNNPDTLLNNLDTVIDNLNALDTVHSKGEALLGGQISDPDLLGIAQNALAEREVEAYTALDRSFDVKDFSAATEHQEQLEETKVAEQEEYDARRDKLIKETDAIINALFENDPEGQAAVFAKRDEKLSAIAFEQMQASEADAKLQAFKLRTESAFRPWPTPKFVTGKQLQERLGNGEITETEVEPEAIAVEGTANEASERKTSYKERLVAYFKNPANIMVTTDASTLAREVYFDLEESATERSLTSRINVALRRKQEGRGVAVSKLLEAEGVLLQIGRRRFLDDEGKQIKKFDRVYRSILAGDYNPELHTGSDEFPGVRIDWEPIDIAGVEVSSGEPEDTPPAPTEPNGQPEDCVETVSGAAVNEQSEKTEEAEVSAEDSFHQLLGRENRASINRQIRDRIVEYYLSPNNKYRVLFPERMARDLLSTDDVKILEEQAREHGFSARKYVRGRMLVLHNKEITLDHILDRLKDHGLTLLIGDFETEVPHQVSGSQVTRLRVWKVMKNYQLCETDFVDEVYGDDAYKEGVITWNMSEAQQKQIAKNKLKAAERAAAGTASGAAPSIPRISGGATPQNRTAASAGGEASSQAQSETQQWIDKITSFTGQAMSALDAISALGTTHRPESRLRIRIDKLDMNGQGKIRTQKLFKQIREAGLATGTDTSRTVRDMVMMYLITDPSIQPLLTHENPEVRRWAKQVVDKGIKDFYLGRGERERRERALSRS